MSSIKMVALIKHPFGTGERDVGEEYEATTGEAATLIALGWAKKSAEKQAAKTPETDQKKEPEKASEVVDEKKSLDSTAGENKRSYQRRDMKAKG